MLRQVRVKAKVKAKALSIITIQHSIYIHQSEELNKQIILLSMQAVLVAVTTTIATTLTFAKSDPKPSVKPISDIFAFELY